MKKSRILCRTVYMTVLIVIYSIFFACNNDESPTTECSVSAELGLVNIDTTTFETLAYEWIAVPEAEEYVFTLDVNGVEVYTEATSNNSVNFEVNPPLQDSDVVSASVQAVCVEGVESEPTKDTFTVDRGGIAAVEVVYLDGNTTPNLDVICQTTCDYVKFDPDILSGMQVCMESIDLIKQYYYSQPDICDCFTNSCGTTSFINCLSEKDKKVFEFANEC